MQYVPQRLERLYKLMQRESINAMIVTRNADVHYLTGYENPDDSLPAACIVVEGESPVLVISNQQLAGLNNESILTKAITFNPDPENEGDSSRGSNFWTRIADLMSDSRVDSAMIGLQYGHLTLRDFDAIKSFLPQAGFKDITDSLWRLRQIKDAAEIDMIRQATRIAEIGLRTALEAVVPGKSEVQVSVEIEAAMRAAGGQSRGIRAVVLTGTRPYRPFAVPTLDRISENSMVLIDVTVSCGGYFSEVARTLHVGTPSETQRALFRYVIDKRQSLVQHIAPGVSIGELVSKVLKSSNKDATMCDTLGNSIGLDLREPPLIVRNSTTSIREGMVFSLHPSFFISEAGAVKVADVVVVNSKGCEVLSSVSSETM